jgi:large subunit ribosomal protein L25
MSEQMTKVAAQPRSQSGSQHARRLRRQGRVPAVVYGHKEAVLHVSVAADEIHRIVRQGTRIIDVLADGRTEKCLIRDLQWDVLGKEIQHIDFTRVSADERIQVTVPIQLRGTAPGVSQGGVLNFVIHQVHIECLATAIPDAIRVNVGELQVGQALHIKELTPPEGVKILGEPEEVVVAVTQKIEVKEPTAAPVEGAVEPEVITARKPAEETEEAEK